MELQDLKNWKHLSIDVQFQTCSPIFFEQAAKAGISISQDTLDHLPELDALAAAIGDFTDRTRDFLPPVFVNYYAPELENDPDPHIRALFQNQAAPYRVQRDAHDPALRKSQTSAVPENKQFFTDLYNTGTKGFVTTGLNSDACILESIKDLMTIGFDIIIPKRLVNSVTKQRQAEGLILLEKAGAQILDIPAGPS